MTVVSIFSGGNVEDNFLGLAGILGRETSLAGAPEGAAEEGPRMGNSMIHHRPLQA